MVSPISQIVADIFIDRWEHLAIEKFSLTHKLCCKYVDDTFNLLRTQAISKFFEHIKSKIQAIQFTYEL